MNGDSGFSSDCINLSPFTKAFHGKEQLKKRMNGEFIGYFFSLCFLYHQIL